jgi:sulfur carrier protein
MKITVNGEEYILPAEMSVVELLKTLNVPQVGSAVAVNLEVVRRQAFEMTRIQDGDKIEIIRAVQGG